MLGVIASQNIDSNPQNTYFANEFIFYFCLFFLVLITMLRADSFGDDTLSYEKLFYKADELSLSFSLGGEALFYIGLKFFKFFDSYIFFIFSFTVMCALLIKHGANNIGLYSYVYFFPYVFTNRLVIEGLTNGIRSALAMILLYVGVQRLEKSTTPLVLLSLCSLFIHFKISVIILTGLILSKYLGYKILITIFIISIISLVADLFISIDKVVELFPLFKTIFGGDRYVSDNNASLMGTRLLIQNTMYVIIPITFVLSLRHKMSLHSKYIIKVLLFLSSLMILFYPVSGHLQRIGLFLILFSATLILKYESSPSHILSISRVYIVAVVVVNYIILSKNVISGSLFVDL